MYLAPAGYPPCASCSNDDTQEAIVPVGPVMTDSGPSSSEGVVQSMQLSFIDRCEVVTLALNSPRRRARSMWRASLQLERIAANDRCRFGSDDERDVRCEKMEARQNELDRQRKR